MKSILCFLIIGYILTISQAWKFPKHSSPNFDLKKSLEKASIQINKKLIIPSILAGSLLFHSPQDANALQSGSRAGGSSFRSSSTRSYSSSPSRSYSSSPSRSYSSTTIIPYPSFTPFYNPFYAPVYGYNPFSGISNLILIGGLLYIATQVIGSQAFGKFGSLKGEEATIIKLNLAVDADWTKNGLLYSLSNIAMSAGDLSNRESLANLLSEASLALLRRERDWVAVSSETKSMRGDNQEAESYFQRLSIKERSKFESESTPRITSSVDASGNTQTIAVVSILVAVQNSNKYKASARSITDTRELLQALAADALTVSLCCILIKYFTYCIIIGWRR